jgi:hypothetical protein
VEQWTCDLKLSIQAQILGNTSIIPVQSSPVETFGNLAKLSIAAAFFPSPP